MIDAIVCGWYFGLSVGVLWIVAEIWDMFDGDG